jgi:hypothetical protein
MEVDFIIIPKHPEIGKAVLGAHRNPKMALVPALVTAARAPVTAPRAPVSATAAAGIASENLAHVTYFLADQVSKAQFWMFHCVRLQCWVYVQFMSTDSYD